MASSSTDNAMAGPAADLSSTTIPEQTPTELQITHSVTVAHILFGPALYPHYLGWQAAVMGYGGAQFPGAPHVQEAVFKARRSDVLGDIPSLAHYKHFMNLMGQLHPGLLYSQYFERSPNPTHSANPKRNFFVCGHRPHPAGKFRETPLCSRCLLRYNIDSLKRIEAAHALLPRTEDGQAAPGTRACTMIWSYQKKFWRALVDDLEVEAGLEGEWETEWKLEGLDVDAAVEGTIRSSEVLKEAVANCPFVSDGWDVTFVPRPSTCKKHISCRYRSILRLHATDTRPRRCGKYPEYLCFSRHENLGTHGNNLTDDPGPSFLLDPSSSGSPDPPSSLDTITSSPQRGSSAVRKKITWAGNVAEYVNRPRACFSRSSNSYQPGRWACSDRRGWAHHGGPEFEPEEEESDEPSSDQEDMEESILDCENMASQRSDGKGSDSSAVSMEVQHHRPTFQDLTAYPSMQDQAESLCSGLDSSWPNEDRRTYEANYSDDTETQREASVIRTARRYRGVTLSPRALVKTLAEENAAGTTGHRRRRQDDRESSSPGEPTKRRRLGRKGSMSPPFGPKDGDQSPARTHG
jgi:hypothetical protein